MMTVLPWFAFEHLPGMVVSRINVMMMMTMITMMVMLMMISMMLVKEMRKKTSSPFPSSFLLLRLPALKGKVECLQIHS